MEKSLSFAVFIRMLFIGVFVYFVCTAFFAVVMYEYFESEVFEDLKNEVSYIEKYVENEKVYHLSLLDSKHRITVIHSDGSVFYDNYAVSEELENHAHRKEIELAMKNGEAKVSRYSSTKTEKSFYYAKKIPSGDIIRVSCSRYSVLLILLGIYKILLPVLFISVFVSAFFGIYIAKKLVEPLNKIDLENPSGSRVYSELKPLIRRIEEENFEKQQREEIRRQYTANVSHELKTPLTSISGFAEILKTENKDPALTSDFAESIFVESQRMIALVNDIIKLSKLDEKSIALEKEALCLNEIVKEVFQVLHSVAAAKKVTMRLCGENGFINGVRPVIYEMVYNLIDNAIKYNVIGGSVEVKISTVCEKQGYLDASSKVILVVKDTGMGIPESEQERIFERFYRIEKSRSKDYGGTGLGLSIVKHAAKYHDASIKLTSREGKGSAFTVVFNSI